MIEKIGDASDNIPDLVNPHGEKRQLEEDFHDAYRRGVDVDGDIRRIERSLRRGVRGARRGRLAHGIGPGEKGIAGRYKWDRKTQKLVRVGKGKP